MKKKLKIFITIILIIIANYALGSTHSTTASHHHNMNVVAGEVKMPRAKYYSFIPAYINVNNRYIFIGYKIVYRSGGVTGVRLTFTQHLLWGVGK